MRICSFSRVFNALSLLSLTLIVFTTSLNGAVEKKKGDLTAYYKRTGAKYLKEISQKEGIIALKSGMLIEILSPSSKTDAKSPTKNDPCEVTYSGTLKDGTKFDAGTTSFSPSQVIKGWTEAMQMMVEGDKWKLYIPYDLAYGERGSPPKIPPFATLVFEIEIHTVKSGGKSAEEAKKLLTEGMKTKEEL